MRLKTLAAVAALQTAASLVGQGGESAAPRKLGQETDEQRSVRMAWWTHDRFGMFIHFGLYSLPARHEWVKSIEKMDDATYDEYFRRFNPDALNVRDWVRCARQAGMKYVVLTTKHHEGFCLFDSKLTDYKITNTKYGRDLVREFAEACRAEGLRVGFYYSLPDWHHPDFPVDRYHPQRPVSCGPWDKAGMEGPEEPWNELNRTRNMAKYREYLYGQLTELLTNYGKVDLLWLDFTMKGVRTKHPEDWEAEKLLALIRRLQPQIIVNDRLGLGETTVDGWDFVTPEQRMPKPGEMVRFGKPVPWETCQTFSGSWGYHRDEDTWKSPRQLADMLVSAVGNGGNLILNVGPTGRGRFDARACERLSALGAWMDANGRAIYGCGAAPEELRTRTPEGTKMTYNARERTLYLHVLEWPVSPLRIAFADRVDYAQLLHDGSEVRIVRPKHADGEGAETAELKLPVRKPDVEIPVVEMFLKQR